MADALLKINGRDYSTWLKLYDGELGVVDAARLDPQFGGVPALTDGAVWISDAAANKHWQVNVMLKPSPLTVDAANQLVRDVQGDLYKGATVEYKPEGATDSTFFDLERGVFRPAYNHPRYRHGYVEGVLELWTRPFGHTGTIRLMASMSGTGMLTLPASGILGDITAIGQLWLRAGTTLPSAGRVALYAVAPHALYQPAFNAPSIYMSGGGGSIVGASGALGSQYAWMPSISASGGYHFTLTPLARTVYGGRNRLLVIARSQDAAGSGMRAWAQADKGTMQPYGPTVALGANGTPWQLLDLGEMSVPPLPATGGDLETVGARINFNTAGPSPATVDLNAAILLPIDTAVGLRTARASPWQSDFDLYTATRFREILFDGPSQMVRGGNASKFNAEETAQFRGMYPAVPAQVPSGPAQVFVFCADPQNVLGNDILSASISVKERFSFFR